MVFCINKCSDSVFSFLFGWWCHLFNLQSYLEVKMMQETGGGTKAAWIFRLNGRSYFWCTDLWWRSRLYLGPCDASVSQTESCSVIVRPASYQKLLLAVQSRGCKLGSSVLKSHHHHHPPPPSESLWVYCVITALCFWHLCFWLKPLGCTRCWTFLTVFSVRRRDVLHLWHTPPSITGGRGSVLWWFLVVI